MIRSDHWAHRWSIASTKLALLAIATATIAPFASSQSAVAIRVAEVELAGPLEAVNTWIDAARPTAIEAHLVAGERRTLAIPLLAPDGPPSPSLELELAPPDGAREGSARFVRWLDDERARNEAAWQSLPPSLRLRPRPPLEEAALGGERRAPLTALLVLAGGFLLTLRWRRRVLLASGVSLAASAAVAVLVAISGAAPRAFRVVEGDGASNAWLSVDAARDHLAMPPRAPLKIEIEPPRARASWSVHPASGTSGERWILRSDGSSIVRIDAFDPGPRTFRPERNAWGELAEAWVRSSDGVWSSHGRWAFGAPLPPALDVASAPPGWLNPALPQGTSVLLGRLASESLGDEGALAPATETWVRLVGF